MFKKFFLLCLLAGVLFSICNAETFEHPVADSHADWDAAETKVPPQGFRNWYFGYYEKDGAPETFTQFPHIATDGYWGDGYFLHGAIMRGAIAWSNGDNRDVVRRWVAPEDGTYRGNLECSAKVKRYLRIFHNRQPVKFAEIGPDTEYVDFYCQMKKGDSLDLAWEKWGSCSLILRAIISLSKTGLVLTSQGKSDYAIMVPASDPDNIARESAELLQRIIQTASGVKLPILKEGDRAVSKAIYIGNTGKAAAAGINIAELADMEYVKKVVGGNVFLAGKNTVSRMKESHLARRGDMKAVVSFLEDDLGVRFLAPGPWGEYIPKLEKIVINNELDVRKQVQFHSRIEWLNYYNDPKWKAFYVAGSMFVRLNYRDWWGHAWPHVVPNSKYGKEHPEYFVLQGGMRHPEMDQLCPSNPDVRRLLTEDILAKFKAGYTLYQLSQADGLVSCECTPCAELGKTDGERIWKLHRAIAEDVYPQYPDRKINILSYAVTQDPPVWFDSFPPNVVIQLSKYDDGEFRKWQKFKVPFMVYTYNWGPYNELGFLPKRTPQGMANQLRRFAQYGVTDIYDCQVVEALAGGLHGPAYYIYSRMTTDISLNPDVLAMDYCRAAYGNAGPVLYNMFSAMHRQLESYPENPYFTCDDPRIVRTAESMITHHFSPTLLRYMEQCMEKAEPLLKTEGEKKRYLQLKLDFDYLRAMVRAYTFYRAWQLAPTEENFISICRALEERKQAISQFLTADVPEEWQWRNRVYKNIYQAGGSQYGILGAPFTWDWENMLSSGTRPSQQKKSAVAAKVNNIPDEQTWASLPEYSLEKIAGGTADLKTSFKICHDGKNIYILCHGQAPGIDKKSFKSVGRDNYIITENFDIMINASGMPNQFYQIIMSPEKDSFLDGTRNIIGADGQVSDELNKRWNGAWHYSFKIQPDEWQACLTIPPGVLGDFQPGKGKSFTMNIGRVHESKLYLWAPVSGRQFGNTEAFGNVDFE